MEVVVMRRAALLVIGTGFVAGGAWIYAAERAQAPIVPLPPVQLSPPSGNILTGPDIGFRVDGMHQGKVVGTMMVRLKDGSWVEAQFGMPRVRPLNSE